MNKFVHVHLAINLETLFTRILIKQKDILCYNIYTTQILLRITVPNYNGYYVVFVDQA